VIQTSYTLYTCRDEGIHFTWEDRERFYANVTIMTDIQDIPSANVPNHGECTPFHIFS
jgi:hypothetical protein